ncbi:hypothetical protein HYR69_12265 [Candidatus Sumerlaeota bacterium]|nr:hypothetical protein [Candidatus Sumerlaeota bacterium]
MQPAIREHVTVKAGGTIEIQRPDLPEGASADVIILLHGEDSTAPPLSSLIGAGRGCFSSIDEVDAFINGLRDEWQ